eukprot:5385939-Pyramimonas_sp.AAC.1
MTPFVATPSVTLSLLCGARQAIHRRPPGGGGGGGAVRQRGGGALRAPARGGAAVPAVVARGQEGALQRAAAHQAPGGRPPGVRLGGGPPGE